ncbi:MAG: hypothetical protein IJ908_09035 [Fibrobacter sp.]|nr:hypothetical protein [Fibrobacter sp.]MBR6941703.1 hypothetical protein [Fibrobacter sp.]
MTGSFTFVQDDVRHFCILNNMKEFFEKFKNNALIYLKSLNWIVLLGIAAFCIVLAIINNIRVEDSKSVDWIGSQEILEKPADIL